jgi:hypothetical protein
MRPIPAEVQTLLKSRSMIGENKPAYEITSSEIGADRYDFTAANTAYQPQSAYWDYYPSYVRLNDGRVLFMFSRGVTNDQQPAALYQTYYPDDETLISGNNTVQNEQVVFANLYTPKATLYLNPAGELFFILAHNGTPGNITAKLEIYKSANGDGSDWALFSTIAAVSYDGPGSIFNDKIGPGYPLFSNGRMILTGPNRWNQGGYLAGNVGIMTSEDGGLTWTTRYTGGSGVWGTTNTNAPSRQIGTINGELWTCWSGDYGSDQSLRVLKSSDNGTNWTMPFTVEYFNIACEGLMFSDSEYMYLLSYGAVGQIPKMRRTNISPTSIDDFEIINNDFPVGGHGQHQAGSMLAIKVGDKIVVSEGQPIIESYYYGMYVVGYDVMKTSLNVKSISISRNKNMAGSMDIVLDNKNSIYSPDNTGTGYENAFWPNTEIGVKQGYGINLVKTFTGLVDRVEMTTFPQEIRLALRDNLKKALDQTITNGQSHVLTYTNQTIEAIFTDLCSKAGITTGVIEVTGITVNEKTFSWETYADCFSWLAELAGFEFGADEGGLVYFRKDTAPATPPVSYVFREGEDIISLGYTIDDNDIYYKIAVYGKAPEGHVVFASKEYVSRNYYSVLSQKFLKIDAPEARTVAECQVIADQAEALMRSRVRTVNFAAIAVPWLQVGDFIQVIESSSTISEIYRITDLSTNMDSSGYTMQITCYHHGAS